MSVFYSPIVMSTPITLAVNGSQVQAEPTLLLNPNRSAMLIDQFTFPWSGPLLTPAYQQQVYVSIQIGAIHVTNGLVPITALCPNYDDNLSSLAGQANTRNPDSITNPLVWHLPKPIYVPANVVTYMNFARIIQAGDPNTSNTINLRAVVKGRSLPSDYPVPSEIYMPWGTAAVVQTTQTTTLATRQTYVTPDNTLGNPNDSRLMITRFIGYRNSNGIASGGDQDLEGPGTFTVRMTISNGKLLVREPTPWYHLFPVSRRYFDVRGILRGNDEVPGGEFVKARVDYIPPQGDGGDIFTPTYLGLIGYRKVPTPPGANS